MTYSEIRAAVDRTESEEVRFMDSHDEMMVEVWAHLAEARALISVAPGLVDARWSDRALEWIVADEAFRPEAV